VSQVILDLCAGTGAWSAPYLEAGYDVRRITLPHDVRLMRYVDRVHGILAAPPCTKFCRMNMCHGRPTDEEFREALSVVDACLRFVAVCQPRWWALENPQGYLQDWLGPPRLKFDPWQYGDAWTKRTWVWGWFKFPGELALARRATRSLVKQHTAEGQKYIARNAVEAATTAPGIARAFFEANP
jgi:hypothetical protein